MENNKKNINGFLRLCFFSLLFLTSGCEKNQAPMIQNVTSSSTEVKPGEDINLSVSANDPDGDALIFLWEADAGEITTENNLSSISWTAPLNTGIFFCKVSVNDGTDIVSDSIPLTVNEDPILHVDKDSLLFDGDKTQDIFIISNTGTGLLDWSIDYSTSDGGNWIQSLTPMEGSTAQNQATTIEVNVDRTGLAGGTYYGTIEILSEDKDTVVQVIMEVSELIVAPAQLDFGSDQTSKILTVRNGGKGIIDFSISVSDSWITVDPNSGGAAEQATEITVRVDRAGMHTGSYTGHVTVSSDVSEKIVGISMDVNIDPELFVNTTSLEFGPNINSRSFFIQNQGGGTLTWTISESLNWLTLNPLSGKTTTETDEIHVVVDRTVLNSGQYTGEIIITSNGGDSNVKVTIEISSEGEWLKYDDDKFDGYYETDSKHQFFLTQFDKPTDWKKFRVSKIAISFNVSLLRDNIELFCFSTQNVLGTYYPYKSLHNTSQLNPAGGWNEWEVDWTLDIDKFCIGYRQIEENTPSVHYDKTITVQRSFYVDTDSKGFPVREMNWAIRVFVEKSDGDPQPGRWLNIVVEPGKDKEFDLSRFIDHKN